MGGVAIPGLLRAFAAIPGVPVAGIATWVAPLGGLAPAAFCAMIQACPASSLAAMSPLAPSGATAMGVQLFFRSGSGEVLLAGPLSGLAALSGVGGLTVLNAAGVLPISLAALAALALPGAGGLMVLTAAGVRIGYRQAKAGFAVRAAGIAGFARPGAVPLGVVHSGSLIVVRPRALPVVCPGASVPADLSIKSPSTHRTRSRLSTRWRTPGRWPAMRGSGSGFDKAS